MANEIQSSRFPPPRAPFSSPAAVRLFSILFLSLLGILPGEDAAAKGWFDSFVDFTTHKIDYAETLDLYGTTAQLPWGIFSIKYSYSYRNAAGRFDSDGNRGGIVPAISFDDPQGGDLIYLDLAAEGQGDAHLIQFSVGITDPLDAFLEIQFVRIETKFNPVFRAGPTARLLGIDTLEDFFQILSGLGRPPPALSFSTDGYEFGDMQMGFSYNSYRGDQWSLSHTGSVFLPTGEIADPNRNLIFALGPEIDRGTGSLQLLLVNNVDFRPWKEAHLPIPFEPLRSRPTSVTFSLEVDYHYYFNSTRESPEFMEPNPVLRALVDAIGLESDFFPDLSDMGETFDYRPGQSVDVLAVADFDLWGFGDFGLQYAFNYTAAARIQSSSKAFVDFAELLELTAAGTYHAVAFVVGPNLLALGVPLRVGFEYDVPFAGSNSLILSPSFKLTVQAFLPVF